MKQVYLNGDFMPMSEAKISPMDRGFLFGDGIYEVIPVHNGKTVGLAPHLARMQEGLNAIELAMNVDHRQWRDIINTLTADNEGDHLGIYIQVSRGADTKRNHAMPVGIDATRFAFAFDIPAPPIPDKSAAKRYEVSATQDLSLIHISEPTRPY